MTDPTLHVGAVLTIEHSWMHLVPFKNRSETIRVNDTGDMYEVCQGEMRDTVRILRIVSSQSTPAGIATDPRFD